MITFRLIHALCWFSVSQSSLQYKSDSAQMRYLTKYAPAALKTCQEVAQRGHNQKLNVLELIAVSYIESRHTKKVKSDKGARGPLQAMPKYWSRKGDKDYITAGLRAWKYYREHSTNLKEAAGKYNGSGEHGQYAQDVQAHYDKLKELYDILRWPR